MAATRDIAALSRINRQALGNESVDIEANGSTTFNDTDLGAVSVLVLSDAIGAVCVDGASRAITATKAVRLAYQLAGNRIIISRRSDAVPQEDRITKLSTVRPVAVEFIDAAGVLANQSFRESSNMNCTLISRGVYMDMAFSEDRTKRTLTPHGASYLFTFPGGDQVHVAPDHPAVKKWLEMAD